MEILITTGTYNCADYRVIKRYVRAKSALNYIKSIGYPYGNLMTARWNYGGTQYFISINN